VQLLAGEADIPTPLTARLFEMIHEIEERRAMGEENLDELKIVVRTYL
jgi:hypothetical protein